MLTSVANAVTARRVSGRQPRRSDNDEVGQIELLLRVVTDTRTITHARSQQLLRSHSHTKNGETTTQRSKVNGKVINTSADADRIIFELCSQKEHLCMLNVVTKSANWSYMKVEHEVSIGSAPNCMYRADTIPTAIWKASLFVAFFTYLC